MTGLTFALWWLVVGGAVSFALIGLYAYDTLAPRRRGGAS